MTDMKYEESKRKRFPTRWVTVFINISDVEALGEVSRVQN